MSRHDATLLRLPSEPANRGDVASWRARKDLCHSRHSVVLVDECFKSATGICYAKEKQGFAQECYQGSIFQRQFGI
jgi:hypothetical protein